MNVHEADREARRRWGKNGRISDEGEPRTYARKRLVVAVTALCDVLRIIHTFPVSSWPKARKRDTDFRLAIYYADGPRIVGQIVLGAFFKIEGTGWTWHEAFQDVERREQAEHERYVKLREAAEATP